jgi:hypothetical protein
MADSLPGNIRDVPAESLKDLDGSIEALVRVCLSCRSRWSPAVNVRCPVCRPSHAHLKPLTDADALIEIQRLRGQ